MVVRPVDTDGDMMPIQNLDQLISGAPAVAQIVQDRLHLLYGEWWEDETLGFRVPKFLVENVRFGDTGMLEMYISDYIAGTEGVRIIKDISTDFTDHKFTYKCAVNTGDSTEELEVDMSGLL